MSNVPQPPQSPAGPHALLFDLLNTASPTGYEQTIQRFIYDRFSNVAEVIEPDLVGNLTLVLNPKAKRKVMLCGHCDQIGFLVKYISDDGYVYLEALGGTDSGVVLGEHLALHGKAGPVTGSSGANRCIFRKAPRCSRFR